MRPRVVAMALLLVGAAAIAALVPPPFEARRLDLVGLIESGVLRVAVPPRDATTDITGGVDPRAARAWIGAFAAEHGMRTEFRELPNAVAAQRALAAGTVDVASGYARPGTALPAHVASPVPNIVHPRAPDLRAALQHFVTVRRTAGPRASGETGDLPAIRQRGVLRVLTRNNAHAYFIHRGAQLGYEVEMMRWFAEGQGLRLAVVTPPSHDELIPWLLAGRGDVVAAAMTPTPERRAAVAFTQAYAETQQVVAARAETAVEITVATDLHGRTVHVRAESAYTDTLEALRARGIDVTIAPLPTTLETEEILAGVAGGHWDLSVADADILAIEQHYGRDLSAAVALGDTVHAWAVRRDNPELHAALDRFIAREHRGETWNVLRQRYFEDPRFVARTQGPVRPDRGGRISPYDELAREAAKVVDLPPALILAVMFRESRFRPEATSWADARGLMQILPRTAAALGYRQLHEPRQGVMAGATYLRRLYDRFADDLAPDQRMAFTLAAYNAGYYHVRDARTIAAERGWDPDRWDGHVARAMRLLERPEVYRQVPYGYARGSAVVAYVDDVRETYRAYAEVLR